MHLLFLEESGSVDPKNKNFSKYFVIAGIIIPEDLWIVLHTKLKELKKEYRVTTEIKWRYFSPNNKEKNNGLRYMSFDTRDKFRDCLYKLITSHPEIKIISIVTDIEEAYKLSYVVNQRDLYWFSYKQIIERFQYYLQDFARETGQKVYGMVFIDKKSANSDKILKNIQKGLLYVEKRSHSILDNLIEGVSLISSHFSLGAQLADVITGAVYRKFEKKDERYFNKIKNSFRRRGDIITGYGLINFPKNKDTGMIKIKPAARRSPDVMYYYQ